MEIIESGYTRVSEIISIFQSYAYVDRKRLKAAQDNGTAVHDAIQAYFRGDFIPLDRKRDGYFQSFLRFMEATNVKPLFIETRLYDDSILVTGKPDLIGEVDGQKIIVDWKTGSWSHVDIWRLQGTFYRRLIAANELVKDLPEIFMFVQLDKDGGKPIVYILEHDPADWEVCVAAMRCHSYFNKKPLNQEGLTNQNEESNVNNETRTLPILDGECK